MNPDDESDEQCNHSLGYHLYTRHIMSAQKSDPKANAMCRLKVNGASDW